MAHIPTSFLHRLPILFATLLCLSIGVEGAYAQVRRQIQLRPYADYRRYHFGFHVGTHLQDLAINNQLPEGVAPGGAMCAEIGRYAPGFSVGLVADYTFILGLDLRVMPTLNLGERNLMYRLPNGAAERISTRSNSIELPIVLQYSSRRNGNIRPYVNLGGFASMQLGQRKSDPVRWTLLDYGLRFGIGCDFYLAWFKLCPELSFSYGFAPIVDRNRPDLADDRRIAYTHALGRTTSKTIVLSFYFE